MVAHSLDLRQAVELHYVVGTLEVLGAALLGWPNLAAVQPHLVHPGVWIVGRLAV